jgi:H+-translocating NAD(P) transhydrogenase subunit alpha
MTADGKTTAAVVREVTPGERRVALTPDGASRLLKAGLDVAVQAGAGDAAGFPDAVYVKAGARVLPDAAAVLGQADLLLKVRAPAPEETAALKSGAVTVSFLDPGRDKAAVDALTARSVSALSMERVPRITRAQSMDALSSQATVAGVKAVLVGASTLGKFLPMMVPAAGTIPPGTVFVIGAGVAGLQAIATARRLGANVRAFDVRLAAKEQVESLGATFVAAEALAADAEQKSGYARESTDEERKRQAAAIAKHVAEADLVITTAQVPGKKAPLIITEEMVRGMKTGSVIVDLAAESGGNCALTQLGQDVVKYGVTILGPANLPAEVPYHASQLYAKNISTFLLALVKDGQIKLDLEDEVVRDTLVAREGRVVQRAP